MGEDDQVEMTHHGDANGDVEGGAGAAGASSRFGVSLDDLKTVNRDRATEDNLISLNDMGGVVALAEALGSDVRAGISSEEVQGGMDERRNMFGSNEPIRPPVRPFWRLYLDALEDPMLFILLICALVSLGVEMAAHPETGWVDGTAIFIAVNIVALVTAINDFDKEKQFRRLNDVNDNIDVRVMRGGEDKMISVFELMVGDVLELETGDKVPADCVFIEGTDVESNESSLTGEPDDLRKNPEKDPFLLSGCQITAGRCTALAIAVGPYSQWGRIKAKLAQPQKLTPLQEKLQEMAKLIGYLGTVAAVLTFTAQFIVWFVPCSTGCAENQTQCPDLSCVDDASSCTACDTDASKFKCWDFGDANDDSVPQGLSNELCKADVTDCPFKVDRGSGPCRPTGFANLGEYLLSAFIIAVTVVVVAIPEGLPLAVTIALAYSTKRMLKDHNLIRQLAACETMGNATNICSDKTGTLTRNHMTVVEGWFAGHYAGESTKGAPCLPAATELSATALAIVREGVCVNSTARIMPPEEGGDGRPKVEGSKTEGALIIMAQDLGCEWRPVRQQADVERLYLFEPRRKMMSTLVRDTAAGGDEARRLHVKGASEIVLSNCTHSLDGSGERVPLTEQQRDELQSLILGMANRALRTIVIAYRDFPDAAALPEDLDTPPESDLTLAAVVGIIDPLREEVPAAVEACTSAGVRVRMVTGDNIHTARAIAKDCGIYDEARGDVALEGPKFRDMTPTELDAVLPRLTVLARSSPEDKHTLVTRLNGKALPANKKEWEAHHPGADWDTDKDKLLPGYLDEWKKVYKAGEIVGVTGDGTNDAPALKTADVGLSMGLSGTEVAKEASHIVIMDDNFASIVNAVRWGRCIYDNIRKFLQFQLTVNFVAIFITFIGAVSGFQPPLSPVMMLWINLIMDTLGALALATEPPHERLLDRFPYRRDAFLLSRVMWRNIVVQVIFQLIVMNVLLFAGVSIFDLPRNAREACTKFAEDGTCLEYDHRHATLIFNTFVFCQLFNQVNFRMFDTTGHVSPNFLNGFHDNALFFALVGAEALLQVFLTEVAGEFMHTTPLSAGHFFATIGIAAITMPLGFLQLYVPPTTEDPRSFRRPQGFSSETPGAVAEV